MTCAFRWIPQIYRNGSEERGSQTSTSGLRRKHSGSSLAQHRADGSGGMSPSPQSCLTPRPSFSEKNALESQKGVGPVMGAPSPVLPWSSSEGRSASSGSADLSTG